MNNKRFHPKEFYTTDEGYYKRGFMKWRTIWYGADVPHYDNHINKPPPDINYHYFPFSLQEYKVHPLYHADYEQYMKYAYLDIHPLAVIPDISHIEQPNLLHK